MATASILLPPPDRTLAGKIRDHNIFNGFLFSAGEFGLVVVATGLLAIVYALRGQWAFSGVCFGIALNALPTVALALQARRQGVPAMGWSGVHAHRAQLRTERPQLLADTLTITILTLIPFLRRGPSGLAAPQEEVGDGTPAHQRRSGTVARLGVRRFFAG